MHERSPEHSPISTRNPPPASRPSLRPSCRDAGVENSDQTDQRPAAPPSQELQPNCLRCEMCGQARACKLLQHARNSSTEGTMQRLSSNPCVNSRADRREVCHGRIFLRASIMCLGAIMSMLPSPGLSQETPEQAFDNACRTCHTTREGDDRLGPNLRDILGRKAGSLSGCQLFKCDEGRRLRLEWGEARPLHGASRRGGARQQDEAVWRSRVGGRPGKDHRIPTIGWSAVTAPAHRGKLRITASSRG